MSENEDGRVERAPFDVVQDLAGVYALAADRDGFFRKRDSREGNFTRLKPEPLHSITGIISSFALGRRLVFAALMLADMVAILAAIALSGLVAFVVNTELLHIQYRAFDADNLQRRLLVWLCLATALCIWFGLAGAYTARKPLQDDMKQSLGALVIVLMIDGFIQFATKETFSRLWIFAVWPIAAVTMPLARIAVRRALDRVGLWQIGAAILGNGEHYASVEHSLINDRYVGYFVAYHCNLMANHTQSISEVAAGFAHDMQMRGAKTVILVPDDQELEIVGKVMDALNVNLIPYIFIPPVKRLPFSGLSIQSVISSDAILMTPCTGLLSPVRQAIKRGFDILVGLTLLIVLAPLFALLSLLIAANGGSPAFGHKRIGRGGRHFRCLKFRTMANNADKILADLIARDPEIARKWRQNFKLDVDPRITAIGRFLRKTSLDELPQLINVVRGEMSLVGPRPVTAEELTRYYGDNAFYYLLVRPGITGLWQVSGRSQTSYERRVFLDAWYVRNWSLWTDLVILFKTGPVVVSSEGAR